MKYKKKHFILDFDSTFVKSEGLEELAELSLLGNPKRELIHRKIRELTEKGMEGKIPFGESLQRRLKLLRANRSHIEKVIRILKKKVSRSILRNKQFFKRYGADTYIVSGGFKEFVSAVAVLFGIRKSHIFANTLRFDKKGNIVGVDHKNPLSKTGGKVKVVKDLHLKGNVYVLGDGYTDYQIRELGDTYRFVAFTENIEREVVANKADHVAPSFDEFLFVHRLPMSISYPKSRIKVLLLEAIHQEAVSLFEREGYEVEWHEKSLREEELVARLSDVKILGIRSTTKVTGEVLSHARSLLTVGAFCVGVDQIDLPAASKSGVAVFNAPYSNTRSVVELVIGEIIMLARGIFDKSRKLHEAVWEKTAAGSFEIRGKTLGIVGYGNIGSQISVLAENMGMRVLFYDTIERMPMGNAVKCRTLHELLKKSDIVTVHVDGKPENRGLIKDREFHWMKNGSLFLNASRGSVVDLDALAIHIKRGKIRGAAIDVFPQEPENRKGSLRSPLQNLHNVILTPHIGGSTVEAQRDIGEFVANRIIEYINTGNTYLSVSFPQLQLPPQKNAHRLLHIHKNVPGVLAAINNTFAVNTINILGQYLKTNNQIGYVITDVNKQYDRKLLRDLKRVPNTIRFRVLY